MWTSFCQIITSRDFVMMYHHTHLYTNSERISSRYRHKTMFTEDVADSSTSIPGCTHKPRKKAISNSFILVSLQGFPSRAMLAGSIIPSTQSRFSSLLTCCWSHMITESRSILRILSFISTMYREPINYKWFQNRQLFHDFQTNQHLWN